MFRVTRIKICKCGLPIQYFSLSFLLLLLSQSIKLLRFLNALGNFYLLQICEIVCLSPSPSAYPKHPSSILFFPVAPIVYSSLPNDTTPRIQVSKTSFLTFTLIFFDANRFYKTTNLKTLAENIFNVHLSKKISFTASSRVLFQRTHIITLVHKWFGVERSFQRLGDNIICYGQ